MINTRILIAVIGLACSAASAQHQEQGKHRQGPAPEGMRNNEGPMDGDHAAPPRHKRSGRPTPNRLTIRTFRSRESSRRTSG